MHLQPGGHCDAGPPAPEHTGLCASPKIWKIKSKIKISRGNHIISESSNDSNWLAPTDLSPHRCNQWTRFVARLLIFYTSKKRIYLYYYLQYCTESNFGKISNHVALVYLLTDPDISIVPVPVFGRISKCGPTLLWPDTDTPPFPSQNGKVVMHTKLPCSICKRPKL